MKNPIPSKQDCCYVLEMLESKLIDFTYIHPWADKIINELDYAPPWLGDLATKKYRGDQTKALREYIYSEPFEAGPDEMEKFHVACLWLRYERREISWATFLEMTGDFLDGADSNWHCGIPYHYHNIYASAYFTVKSEKQTKKRFLAELNLQPWIAMAKEKFEPFKNMRMLI